MVIDPGTCLVYESKGVCKIFLAALPAVLLVLFLALPQAALADPADPDGVKLKAISGDKAKANTEWATICNLEIITIAGEFIWNYRRDHDKCGYYRTDKYKKLHPEPDQYCVRYSQYCKHYQWGPDCLSQHDPKCKKY